MKNYPRLKKKQKKFETNPLQAISDLNCSLLFAKNIYSICFTLPLLKIIVWNESLMEKYVTENRYFLDLKFTDDMEIVCRSLGHFSST